MQKKASVVREPLVHLTKRKALHPAVAMLIRVAAFLLGMVVCGLVAFILIEKIRQNPEKIYDFYYCFYKGSFVGEMKQWKFLKDTAVLLCIALALTPAFRMRFWNTGAEGQTLVGILAAIAVNFYLGGKFNPAIALPDGVLLALEFIAAIIAGAVWGVIPALFKAQWNTNETLFTLMMNYVASFLVSFFLVKWVANGSSSLGKLDSGKMPVIFSGLSKPQYGDYLVIIILILILTVLLHIYIHHSKHGYELNVVGESLRTANYVGINVKKVIIRTMLLSGMLCGFAGWVIGAGLDRSVNPDSVGGQGFTAIMVAWLAKFNPAFMIFTSAIVIFLEHGASQISTTFKLSEALPDVIVGIVLLFIIGSEFFINYKLNFRRKGDK